MSDPTPVLSTAKLALEYLFEQIQAGVLLRVPDPTLTPNVVFGWRQAPQQMNQGPSGAARVVVQPGDATGKVGDLGGAKLPGRNPAPMATMGELATLFLWAVDATDPESDLAQWRAARRLHDLVIPIVIRTFRSRWKQVSKAWLKPETERRYGAEMQVVISVEAMIPDDVLDEAAGGTVTTIDQTISANGGAAHAC